MTFDSLIGMVKTFRLIFVEDIKLTLLKLFKRGRDGFSDSGRILGVDKEIVKRNPSFQSWEIKVGCAGNGKWWRWKGKREAKT